ncbi:hypothetical protein Hanom_Chr00s001197g01676071 [Helianthus anomalus]
MAYTGGVGSSWMGGEVLPIIPFSCLRRVEVGFLRIWESQGAGDGRVVDLGHDAQRHGSWHIVPCRSKKYQLNNSSKKSKMLKWCLSLGHFWHFSPKINFLYLAH